jgi:hypothetical protein
MPKQPVNREVFALLTAQRPVAAAAPDKNIISKEFASNFVSRKGNSDAAFGKISRN